MDFLFSWNKLDGASLVSSVEQTFFFSVTLPHAVKSSMSMMDDGKFGGGSEVR